MGNGRDAVKWANWSINWNYSHLQTLHDLILRQSLATTLLLGVVLFTLNVQAAVRVEIEGLPTELETNTRAFLTLVERARRVEEEDEDEPMSASIVRRLYARASEEIKLSLQPYGYYKPVIQSRLESLPQAGADKTPDFLAHFIVSLGPRTRYRHINLEVQGSARNIPAVEGLLQSPGIAAEQPLLHAEYNTLKTQLQQLSYRAGYLDAQYAAAELKIYPDLDVADVTLTLDGGEPYFFGSVSIEQDVLEDEFIARYIKIRAGEPFNTERLIDLQLSLSRSAYFANVAIDVRRADATDHRIPVVLRANPIKPQKYTAKLGFGTDTGPRAGLGLEIRRLNRFGHQLDTDIQGSSRRTALGAEYRLPIYDVDTDHLAFFLNIEEDEVADADTNEISIGTRLENNWWVFRRQMYLRFRTENFKFGAGPTEEATLLTPGIELHYQTADDLAYTRRGFSTTFDIHGGIESLITDTTFLQSTLSAHVVLPLASRARLLLRGQVGFTNTDNFDELPPSERFYAGGDHSVRGYAYESLTPEDENGNEIGGRYLSTGSIEVDYLVRGNLGFAAFYDLGNATRDLRSDFKAAVGLGLRYRTQIGMIRIDLAHPLNDDDTDIRLHLTVGPDL